MYHTVWLIRYESNWILYISEVNTNIVGTVIAYNRNRWLHIKYECNAIGDRTWYPGGLPSLQFHLLSDHEGRYTIEHPYGRIFKLKLGLSSSINKKRIIYIHKKLHENEIAYFVRSCKQLERKRLLFNFRWHHFENQNCWWQMLHKHSLVCMLMKNLSWCWYFCAKTFGHLWHQYPLALNSRFDQYNNSVTIGIQTCKLI